ncbi:MAG: MFS transporter [Halopenitus sp.]
MNENDRRITAFVMLGHAMFHTYELVIPIFAAIWLDAFGTTEAVLGVVLGTSYALTGVGALPSGILADRFSSKRLIVACLVGMGGAFALVSVATNVVVVAVALLLWGAAASLYHPAGLALISRGASERGTAFAYHGAAGNVGVATGPLLAAVLLVFLGWRTVAAVLVVPVVLVTGLALQLEFDETAGSDARNGEDGAGEAADSSRGQVGSLAELRRNTTVLFTGGFSLVFIVGILYGVYYRGAFTFLPEILAGVPLFEPVSLFDRTFEPSQYVYSGLLLLGGVGQYAGGKLVDRIQAEYTLVGADVALVLVALAFIPATTGGLAPLLVVAGLLGFLVFMVAPINQEVISQYVPADVRGLSFGYTYTGIFGVGALGATLSGVVLSRWSPAVLFMVLAGVAGAAALVAAVLLSRWRRAGEG